jgi:ATP-dependent protease ClpP protease subunit
MLDIYVTNCIKGKFFKERYEEPTEAKVKTFIKKKLKDGDWYLSSNEAVYYGFADGVLSTRKYRGLASLK